MSGHSKWATIKHKKGAVDKARGKLFNKLARQLEVAARAGGGDPDSNPTLRTAIQKAKGAQMTNDAIDLTVRRNGYGRQLDSFETDLAVDGLDAEDPFHGVFIRAPRVESVGPAVEVLAEHEGVPVLVRQGRIMAASFHPELTSDPRLHEQFVALVRRPDEQER